MPPSDPRIQTALHRDRTIDITTIGRRSGQPRRIEIWFHQLNGRTYISGRPGRRGWYANLLARPDFVFHLKHRVHADLEARARPVTDPEERQAILRPLLAGIGQREALSESAERSPIVEVHFLE